MANEPITKPYLLFLGDAPDQLSAKVAQGVRDWRPDDCVGQFRMAGCKADVGLSDIAVAEAAEKGARTLVVGVANRGGVIAQNWGQVFIEAMEHGLDLAAGLHTKLADVPELRETAEKLGRRISDVRHPARQFDVASGVKRAGRRILTVGTDCSCGKMYTSLALDKEMRARGMPATFRATGQTGILIAGEGVAVDAVVADFISGAVEALAPDAAPEHWDVIEGQGSLFHASYAGVSLGLLHGAQPDALVLCHEPTRTHMRGLPDYPLPGLEECMEANLAAARLTNKDARFAGVSVNTAALDEKAAEDYLRETERRLGLPVIDAFRHGTGRIVDGLG